MLRVTAPVDFGPSLLPDVLAEFMRSHPGIVVDLRLSNRSMDLVEEGIDVAVRFARSLDGQYVARPLAVSRLAIWGAPAYFKKFGRPRVPEDLATHRSLVFAEPRPMDELVFERGGKQTRVKLNPVMTTNNGEAVRLATIAGVGLGTFPSFLTRLRSPGWPHRAGAARLDVAPVPRPRPLSAPAVRLAQGSSLRRGPARRLRRWHPRPLVARAVPVNGPPTILEYMTRSISYKY